MQPSNISAIFAKVEHFNFGQITNHLFTAISRVSAPISPRQQRHLAFISEFNVQILYLPGLKNAVADFLSRPNKTTTGSVAATSAADPVDLEEMAAEQNLCPEKQLLLGGTSLKLAFRQTGAQGLAGDVSTGNFRQLFPSISEKTFLSIFTMSPTPGGSPPVVLFHRGLCGAVFPATSPPGPVGVWPASGVRSTATHTWSPSPDRNGVFLIYMLIWWAHCSTVIILIIFLLSLIARPSGWKPSLFQKRPRRHAQKF
jgi:hypothetical protein